jgi:thymidylate synthase
VTVPMYETFADAYRSGLTAVVGGNNVGSVRDPLSKASGFGSVERPARELIGYSFGVENPHCAVVSGPVVVTHAAYSVGLLAYTLAGSNDLETLAYYRTGAREYSDDGRTLSGSFGARLRGVSGVADQLSAVVERLRVDPWSRRTFAVIATPDDNLHPSREYPCAAGVQLFVRDEALQLLTVMRAQQAFTVLPYDAFLFMGLQLVLSAMLGLPPGPYRHFSGTFHIYDAELADAEFSAASSLAEGILPAISAKADKAVSLVERLIQYERDTRIAALAGERDGLLASLRELEMRDRETFELVFRAICLEFALRKCGLDDEAAHPRVLVPESLDAFA